MSQPVLRFAPSPNGFLHLGHAFSALVTHDTARALGGRFLLRIEDIDVVRCRPEFESAIYEDLAWLGLSWEAPVRRQSQHFPAYEAAAERLKDAGLLYPCYASRREIADAVAAREAESGRPWPRDPDGAPVYPGVHRGPGGDERDRLEAEGLRPAWRLDMGRAVAVAGEGLSWRELDEDGSVSEVRADPLAWGDVVILRKDVPASYHLAVTLDDALQGVTHVTRGRDLFQATSVHRLLQRLLGLPEPLYRHHRLILGDDGRKLSKSRQDTALRALREAGRSPGEIRQMIGLGSSGISG
ncbi:tRNA glutamyl-Q(34) synthetase GluQRS [Lutibaculum baratangense]|uniref:Glutamyl-Q-tRNA synthetase n=1 Tax=Lutibaculum baratangense AMV1 TaxID=631454 RepID=V4RLN6_9HYPH|nr:tRNA glutamyl-Q(34) synthetase GluQRS [Lutibaculum baratangense]ESR24160.1 glutamyl-Q-tRNA synthetase [Lutibaculum baratangense AMV1]